jgi:hypothetical protein
MTAAAIATALLAVGNQEQMVEALRRGFQNPSRPMDTTTLLALLAALCLVVWLLARLAEPRRRREEVAEADYLTRSVELLNLDRGECNDVQTVARHAGLPHPTAMLLSPANLAHAVRLAQRVHPDPQLGQRLSKLSVKLFGTGLGETTDADGRVG